MSLAYLSMHWMSEANLLVFSGDNAEVYWEARGHPGLKATYPYVVFAISPTLGLISTEYLRTDGKNEEGGPVPVWYLLNANGHLIQGGITKSDAYIRDPSLPPIEQFYLEDLPAVLARPSAEPRE